MLSTKYKKQPLQVNDNTVATVLVEDAQGCANLAAIHNIVAITYGSRFGNPGTYEEGFMKSVLNDMVEEYIKDVSGISNAQANQAKMAIHNIRTESLQPRLGGHIDFVPNGLTLFCQLLKLQLRHCWVLDPEDSSYDILKDFSHSQVVYHYQAGNDLETCKKLLDDSNSQLTSYGFHSLADDMWDEGAGLIFWHNRLDVIHSHNGSLFIYVVDQATREKMPSAIWMLFEERQDENIYFTDNYTPVKNQPHKAKALKWYKEYLENVVRKAKEPKEDKGKASDADPTEPTLEKLAPAAAVKPAPAAAVKPAPEEPPAEKPAPAAAVKPAPAAAVKPAPAAAVKPAPEEPPAEKPAPAAAVKPAPAAAVKPAPAAAVKPAPEEPPAEKPAPAAAEEPAPAAAEEPAPAEQSVDGGQQVEAGPEVKSDVHAEFLEFLKKFQDKGCSTYYFEGVVAAFAVQEPLFYVPYEFIMTFNEKLALKIQDNYSGIYEDLRKAVVSYLSKKGVEFPDVVLKIFGRPAPKSVQPFLDFLQTIMLHENYSIHGGSSEALPSYDSRRMALGYLKCLVVKFKSGRCWAGKWDEANMKVLNGSKFVIDLDEDCELDAEGGFLDLNRFCKIVLDRLKVNGKFPPYFDELADDHMLINECFGKSDKWNRFLQLISNPLALKPPLVRAAFICNVYVVGAANSSGDPPMYSVLSSRKNCFVDWRTEAKKNPLLLKVYEHSDRKRKFKYLIDIWSPKHWHVFKFSGHFIHHVLDYTKGDDLIQKINDISVVDILLARTLWKAIASSFRFLVLNCGVDGLFSSAWRHYVGSDYADKPNEEDTTSNEMVQELLDNISEQKTSGYVYSEISVYSEPQHVSLIITDADLIDIQSFLNDSGLTCVHIDARLYCGSTKLWQRIHSATEESVERGVIVVEGPYSAEYDSVYAALVEFLGLPPTL